MKYSLKNEYKELLKEEVVQITHDNGKELYNINFSPDKVNIINGQKFNADEVLSSSFPDTLNFENVSKICNYYCNASLNSIYSFIKTLPEDITLRTTSSNETNDPVEYLNKYFKATNEWSGANKKGRGEAGVHIAFNTIDPLKEHEPDAVFTFNGEPYRVSIKSFKSSSDSGASRGGAQMGGKPNKSVDPQTIELKKILNTEKNKHPNLGTINFNSKITYSEFSSVLGLINRLDTVKTILALLKEIRLGVWQESPAEFEVNYVIGVLSDNSFVQIEKPEDIILSSLTQTTRWQFKYGPAHYATSVEDLSRQAGTLKKSASDINKILRVKYKILYPAKSDELDRLFINLKEKKKDWTVSQSQGSKSLAGKINEILGTKFSNLQDFINYIKTKEVSETELDNFGYNIIDLLSLEYAPINLPSSVADFIKLTEQRIKQLSPRSDYKGIENYEIFDFASVIQDSEPITLGSYNIEEGSKKTFTIKKQKLLKEVYSHLFKKKLISEGGLAGHMMHPYEALDMTPRQIIDRIKEYSTSQSIIEKVDGQNLFFTVEQDGTLMFARNKEDMTHDDLVEKFTNHPAEVPFVTGGNAIKKGIDQWLSSAGSFGQQEILDIFHPDGEARSFVNFEIMHKDHPNQIEYGENYIVFHSIVDFIDGREAVYSSNNSKRLDKLINLMKPGIESSGYTLASNRTVDLNSLTNVQISEYVSRIKDIANSLDISEDEFLGDGVQKQIQKKISELGVNISEDALNILYDFALYGEDKHGNSIKSKDFTKLMDKEDVAKLRSIGLTSASKALSFVLKTLSPFKDVFVDLGIDLLDGVPSSYMRQEVDLANIDTLREKLQTAMDDLENYMSSTPESDWDALVVRLKPHYDKVNNVGVYNAISTSVEGGVYDYQGDLLKVTGGFAPMNQILGAAYRDKKGIFPSFKEKFMQQESNRRSLKTIFNSIF